MKQQLPISAWPEGDRPRERLLTAGPAGVADAELIAILLGSGAKGKSALDVARQLIQDFDGLTGMGRISSARLSAVSGVGPAKAARVMAACELGRRREVQRNQERKLIRTAADAAGLLSPRLRDAQQETFWALLLDTRHRVLAEWPVSRGGLDQVAVNPRDVFQPALEYRAAAVLVAHNHPSGDAEPSPADIALTRRLAEAAQLLGIRFLDHIIIGDGVFISLAEKGQLTESNKTNQPAKSSVAGLRSREQTRY